MPNWNDIVEKHCKNLLVHDGYSFFYENGITQQVIDQFSKKIDFVFPAEFKDLYALYNGFGSKPQEAGDMIWWVCVPIQSIPELIESTNFWYKETHPKCIDLFIPFIDFGNGDCVGYLLDTSRAALPGLYCFEHEKYDADDDELEFSDFVTKTNQNLEEYLLSMEAR